MNAIIGIDVGGSTTKIVGYYENGKLIGRGQVEAADPQTSASDRDVLQPSARNYA